MDLGNLVEIVVHHLLIGWMTSHGGQDGFPIVSALLRIVTHWTRPMTKHDIRLSIIMIH